MKAGWIAAVLVSCLAAAQDGGPSPTPTASLDPLVERELKAARSYLEGWFGAPLVLPPVEVTPAGKTPGSGDLPGQYHNGVVRILPATVQREAELRRVLRHELTHAVVDQRTRGNCPHWFQEGMAQFLDGTDVVAIEKRLRLDPKALIPLFRIEGPFVDHEPSAREQAYRQSASAVSFLISRIRRSGLLFLIQRLGEGRPFDRALLETGLSYAELQQAWESSLRLPGSVR